MLEKLDEIKWHELKTSFGQSATDVPRYIRQLLSPSAKERDKAKWMLESLLCNEYQVGTATLAAIPFLIELLEADPVADKQNIIPILEDSLHYTEATPEDLKRLPFRQLEVQVGQAISAALDTYIQLLEYPDWEVRLASMRLLVHGNFPKKEWQRIQAIYQNAKRLTIPRRPQPKPLASNRLPCPD